MIMTNLQTTHFNSMMHISSKSDHIKLFGCVCACVLMVTLKTIVITTTHLLRHKYLWFGWMCECVH